MVVFIAFFTKALTLSCSSMFISLCFRFISFHKIAPLYVIESFKVFVLKWGADSWCLARREQLHSRLLAKSDIVLGVTFLIILQISFNIAGKHII